MPPIRGGTGREHARPEHRVGRPVDERRHEVLDHLGRVLPVAVQQHDDVETVLDGPAVPGLLVAAVAEVPRVADHGDRELALRLVLEPDVVGVVLAGVVAHEDMGDAPAEPCRDPVEHLTEGRGGVVRHHQDSDALHGPPRASVEWRSDHKRADCSRVGRPNADYPRVAGV